MDVFERELKQTPSTQIAFLTFTRSAWGEAVKRSGRGSASLPFVRTIHSICYRSLGLTSSEIVKAEKLKQFSKLTGVPILGQVSSAWVEEAYGTNEDASRGDRLLQLDHYGRHRLVKREEILNHPVAIKETRYFVEWFLKEYYKWKEQEMLLDYTDFLEEYLAYGESLDIDVMIVDEAQDLSPLQWAVVWKLGRLAKRIYLAGDDDQAIFAWAGAWVENFMEIKSDDVQVLNQSYRLPRAVWHTAREITKRIGHRKAKQFKPRDAEGRVSWMPSFNFMSLQSCPVKTFLLFRNNFYGLGLKKMLEELGIAFKGTGSILDWPNVVTFLKRLDKDQAWVKDLPRLPPRARQYLSTVLDRYEAKELLEPQIQLMSIHRAKGKEADRVILFQAMARETYRAFLKHPDEEHRVWYVGITRAREELVLVRTSHNDFYPI